MKSISFRVTVKDVLLAVMLLVISSLLVYINGLDSDLVRKNAVVFSFVFPVGVACLAVYYKMASVVREQKTKLDAERETIATSQRYLGELADGHLDITIEGDKNEGSIFKSMDKLRQSLQQARDEERTRLMEDKKRNWANEGFAKFGEILRQPSTDFNEYCYSIIYNMVKYLGANQGGIFIVSDEKDQETLELKACYAYDRKKHVEKMLEAGEGLAWACYAEKETILMTNVPKDYPHITSGLGGQTPGCVIIVPLKTDKEVCGVIEIASFDNIEKHQVLFIEKIAESIASSICNARVNIRTAYLLEQSKQQAEEMRAQEEEMRQNNEELLATQEEIGRQNNEMQRYQKHLKEKEEKLREAACELELVEQKLRGNIERLKKEDSQSLHVTLN